MFRYILSAPVLIKVQCGFIIEIQFDISLDYQYTLYFGEVMFQNLFFWVYIFFQVHVSIIKVK